MAFIDEAGDAGNKYGKGSSEFLVMGCVVVAAADLNHAIKVFEETKAERGHNRQIRKFSECGDKEKFVLTKLLAQKKVRIIQVALHKPSMEGSFVRSNPRQEYNYLVKWTVERVSWLARDAARGGPPLYNQCQLHFSEQRVYPYSELCDYLNKIQKGQERYNCSAVWDYINEDAIYSRHKNETPIHLADTVASAFHHALEPKQHGMTDERFQANLLPALYRRSGKVQGLKLYPPKAFEQMRRAGRFAFLRQIA